MSTAEVIFIDESGDCGLSQASKNRRPYFSLGYVYCKNSAFLRKKLRRQLRRQHRRNRYPLQLRELKFYLPHNTMKNEWGYSDRDIRKFNKHMPKFRKKAIDIILGSSCGVHAAILKKDTIIKPTWTSERLGNYIFARTLLQRILNTAKPSKPPVIIFDAGRLSFSKTRQFQHYVTNKESYLQHVGFKKYLGSIGIPLDKSSVQEPGIWAADIIAGSFYHKYVAGDSSYADKLSISYIGKGESKYWF